MAEFEEAVRLNPDFAEAHVNLGRHAGRGPADGGDRGITQAALRANPDFVEAAQQLRSASEFAGTKRRGDRAISRKPCGCGRIMPRHTANLGIALVRPARSSDGVEQFEQALQLKPDITGYANLAMAYAQAGRTDEAILAADRALELARAQGQHKIGDADRKLAEGLSH